MPFPTIWPLSCSDCDAVIKEASFKRDIIRHAKKRHSIDLDTVLFEYKFCKEAFPDRRKATTHQATHFKDPLFEIETYPCSSCNRAFAMQKALSRHNRQCKVARPIEQDGCSLSSSMRGSQPPVPSPPAPQFSDSEDPSSTNEDYERPDEVPPPPQITRSVDPPGIDQRYECRDKVDENFNADRWLESLIPAKSKTSRKQRPKQSTLSEAEIQKLYCTNMKRAIDYIEGHQKILCRVNPDVLKSQMTVQLGSKPVIPPVPNTWRQCWRNREALLRPFSQQEVKAALDHASSAPSPDGWTYANLAQLKGFVPAFTSGLHQLAASGATPDR